VRPVATILFPSLTAHDNCWQKFVSISHRPAAYCAPGAHARPRGRGRTAEQLDPASVPAALIGRRLDVGDLAVKKPPAPSVRRRGSAIARTG
jgi:hypothetical protein